MFKRRSSLHIYVYFIRLYLSRSGKITYNIYISYNKQFYMSLVYSFILARSIKQLYPLHIDTRYAVHTTKSGCKVFWYDLQTFGLRFPAELILYLVVYNDPWLVDQKKTVEFAVEYNSYFTMQIRMENILVLRHCCRFSFSSSSRARIHYY